jgi:hypothetical protein
MLAGFLFAALPLFYPGENVSVPCGHARIFDDSGVEVFQTACGTVRHSDIGGRFGAFMCVSEARTNWFAFLSRKNVKPCPWIGTGVHPSHGWRKGDIRLSEAIASAGIGVVRLETNWARCETKKGEYAPLPGMDAFVHELARRGITANILITYGNKLYDNPLDPHAYAAFCAWTAERYRPWTKHFEIWNEPQNFYFPQTYGQSGWLDKFIELTSCAKNAVRCVVPDAVVGVAAEDVESWLDAMIRRGIAGEKDLIAFHPYCHRQHRPEREYFLKDFGAKHRALAEKHGGAMRFAITEAGWTTFDGTGTFWQVAGSYPKASYSGQADCIVRFYLAALAAGVEFACQYDFKDDGPRRDHTEHNFGLMFEDFSPKPSYAAVATLSRMVGQAEFIGRMESDPARYRVMRFKTFDRNILVCWAVEGCIKWHAPEETRGAVKFDLYGNHCGVNRSGVVELAERPLYLVW